MTRPQILWVIASCLLAIGGIGILCFVLRTRSMAITKENFDRIENGMSKKEVIAILGKPDTRRFKGAVNPGTEAWNEGRDPNDPNVSGPMIHVDFDEEDRCKEMTWFPPQGSPPSFLDRVIGWFK